ncbi:hypothetical protein CH252_40150, partial [Rhodococcus sp. 06-1477-1B]
EVSPCDVDLREERDDRDGAEQPEAGVGVGGAGVDEAEGRVEADGAGDEVTAGSGRSRAKAKTPATATTTTAAIAIAAIRPADTRRGRPDGDGVEARDIETFRAGNGEDPAVRHDLAAAGLG